jgi:phenylalanine-4-hydroxylase
MSSNTELVHALESDWPERRPFDPLAALRTPYRIDILQPIYYVLDDFRQLVELGDEDLLGLIDRARELGLYEFTPTQESTRDRTRLRAG